LYGKSDSWFLDVGDNQYMETDVEAHTAIAELGRLRGRITGFRLALAT
jgi:hypothetical protein